MMLATVITSEVVCVVHVHVLLTVDHEGGFFGHDMEDRQDGDDLFGDFFGGGGGFEEMNVEFSTSQGTYVA